MSTPASPLDENSIVATLRAAGCVFAEDEARLLVAAAGTPEELAAKVERRAAGLPLEHVIGWAEFCGLRIVVEPGVFVPRRRTEFLVQLAADLVRDTAASQRRFDGNIVLVDLCCGSGAISAAVAASVRSDTRIELHAADVDPVAVRCARRNVADWGGSVYEGDLYGPLPRSVKHRVTVLTANTPYVPTGDLALMPPEAKLHEPRLALDGGADGLDIQRRVAAGAAQWLAPGGHLLIEASERQAPQTAAVMADGGLEASVLNSDELAATVVVGTLPEGVARLSQPDL